MGNNGGGEDSDYYTELLLLVQGIKMSVSVWLMALPEATG